MKYGNVLSNDAHNALGMQRGWAMHQILLTLKGRTTDSRDNYTSVAEARQLIEGATVEELSALDPMVQVFSQERNDLYLRADSLEEILSYVNEFCGAFESRGAIIMFLSLCLLFLAYGFTGFA